MALPAAIALSGLNQEYFSDGLNDVFNHGAVLLKSPSASSVSSQESGISSMSGESSVARNLAPYFELLFKTTIELKTSDTEEEEFTRKPGCESEIKETKPVHKPPPKPELKPYIEEIFYSNRNILDLASNIQWNWDFEAAEIGSGSTYFFENRSQFSRVWGARIPQHVMVPCNYKDCRFEEPQY